MSVTVSYNSASENISVSNSENNKKSNGNNKSMNNNDRGEV